MDRLRLSWRGCALWGLLALLLPGAERLAAQISPGRLSQPHAELDANRSCPQCHATGQGVSAAACLDCHELLGERIEAGQGLHARDDYRSCETCHIEHHGRDFELVWWGEGGIDAFDHDLTGHSLVGAHDRACRDCHQASKIVDPEPLLAFGKDLDRTFLGLGTGCLDCHVDPHRGHLEPTACIDCHDQEVWSPATLFDHDRTDFALVGGHAEVDCASCHVSQNEPEGEPWVLYRGTSTACVDCHDDFHEGRLGRDCASCHGVDDWNTVDRTGFDHDRTRYPLRGRHLQVECASCHTGGSYRIAGFEQCATCHADVHLGQFRERASGGECAECHDTDGFAPSSFGVDDHETTQFPLTGAHREVGCAECHQVGPTAELVAKGLVLPRSELPRSDLPAEVQVFALGQPGCVDCHRDPHAGSVDAYLGELGCQSCHGSGHGGSGEGVGDTWRVDAQRLAVARFDHGTTEFELLGTHRTVGCVDCHDLSGSGTAEALLSFEGAPTDCRGCHEDPHRGQFVDSEGPSPCSDCHSSEGWVPSLFDHDTDSIFPLDGAHQRVACEGCHPVEVVDGQEAVRYKPVPTSCASCHGSADAAGTLRW